MHNLIAEIKKSGTEEKCIEVRELIIALPEFFPDLYAPDRLLQMFTNRFKEKYGVECVSALLHSKRKRYQEMADRQNTSHTYQSWDKGAR